MSPTASNRPAVSCERVSGSGIGASSAAVASRAEHGRQPGAIFEDLACRAVGIRLSTVHAREDVLKRGAVDGRAQPRSELFLDDVVDFSPARLPDSLGLALAAPIVAVPADGGEQLGYADVLARLRRQDRHLPRRL